MDPDRLEFLKKMLARRTNDWQNHGIDFSETYDEWYRESPWEMHNRGQRGERSGAEILEEWENEARKKLKRNNIKEMFEAEDARSLRKPYDPYFPGKQGNIEDLLSSSRRSKLRPLLDKAKGIKNFIPKGPGKAFSVFGLPGLLLGLAFDQLTAAPGELGSGEDEILRQLKGDTDGLSEKEMMQYWEQLADIKSFDDIY
jgi:hypothetical protein|tara:strand:- start:543 stop:1139 length:597 start_codon:yes stop_codon:yes gene_type:complete